MRKPTSEVLVVLSGAKANGATTLVDKETLDRWGDRSWNLSHGYVVLNVDGRRKFLHRLVNDTPSGLDTDHKNGDPLDNRRQNLRTVTRSKNLLNKKSTKGYDYCKHLGKWRVRVGKEHYGYYQTEQEAKNARRAALSGKPRAKKAARPKLYPRNIYRYASNGKFCTRFVRKGEEYFKGYFDTVSEAVEARDELEAQVAQAH